jgi:hypothetical protein
MFHGVQYVVAQALTLESSPPILSLPPAKALSVSDPDNEDGTLYEEMLELNVSLLLGSPHHVTHFARRDFYTVWKPFPD